MKWNFNHISISRAGAERTPLVVRFDDSPLWFRHCQDQTTGQQLTMREQRDRFRRLGRYFGAEFAEVLPARDRGSGHSRVPPQLTVYFEQLPDGGLKFWALRASDDTLVPFKMGREDLRDD